jgi:ATP-dependent helicase/nuclease subunit A
VESGQAGETGAGEPDGCDEARREEARKGEVVSSTAPIDPRISDAAARLAVRTRFDGAIVLEAGAGTGKTTALVARLCAWLLDRGFDEARRELGDEAELDVVAGRALDGVLAITFTDAAAADMDKKIRAALALIENGKRPQGMDEHRFACDDTRCRARARALRRALDRPLARTIHAWCRTLLAEHALEAHLHPTFDVDVDGTVVRELARREVARELTERLRGTADPDGLTLAARKVSPANVEDALVQFALDGQRGEGLDVESFSPEIVTRIDRELATALNKFLADCSAPLRIASKKTPLCGTLVDQFTSIQTMLEIAASDAAELTDRATIVQQTLTKGTRLKLAEWAEGTVGAFIRKDIPDSIDQLVADSRALADVLFTYQRLDPVLEQAARRILLRLGPRLRDAYVQRGVETFGDLLRDASELLARDARLVARLRNTYRQVLVDEFQDTDPLQCEIVHAIALADTGGRRPGLLIVGDPKQSIYGWRRADLRAYAEFVERVLAEKGELHTLSLNFRSGPAILERVERAMRVPMRAQPGVQPSFQPLVAHRANAPSRLEHWNVPVHAHRGSKQAGALEARAEARFLARELRAGKAQNIPWREMGVLMRTMGSLEIVLDELRDADIPFDVVGDKSYYRRREVQDAAALFSCILDRSDHLALVALLRSPFVGVPDAAWIPLWRSDFPRAVAQLDARRPEALIAVRAIVKRALAEMPAGVPSLDRIAGFEHALDHALEVLALLRASFASEACDVFIERARQLLALEATAAARWQGAYRVANLGRFFQEIEAELERTGGDTLALLRYLRESIADAADTAEAKPRDADLDAVQIQTIHKSKGLDYREVFVIGLQKASRRSFTGRDTCAIDGRAHVLFGAPNREWFEVEKRRDAREAAESVRLLYVAMTRAKDRLVLSGTLNKNPSAPFRDDKPPTHLLSLLEPVLADVRPFLLAASDGAAVEHEHEGILHRVVHDTAVERRDESRVDDSRGRLARAGSDSVRLAQEKRLADARSSRPLLVPMSLTNDTREPWTERRQVATHSPGAAALAGTAVHAALEELNLAGDFDATLSAAQGKLAHRVEEAARYGIKLDSADIAIAKARAHELFLRFAGGPLRKRLERIAPHVVARELALLASGPVVDDFASTASGAIDLVYRDIERDELVVVDFKTDAVSNAAEARAAAEGHRGQMETYRSALARALALPRQPRAELWFLAAGEIVSIE